MQVHLNLQVIFINSTFMIEGPSPSTIQVQNEVETIMTCSDIGSDRPPCDLLDNRFSYTGSFRNGISFVINNVNLETNGTYTATALVTEPSITFTKTFNGRLKSDRITCTRLACCCFVVVF